MRENRVLRAVVEDLRKRIDFITEVNKGLQRDLDSGRQVTRSRRVEEEQEQARERLLEAQRLLEGNSTNLIRKSLK